MDNPNPIPSVPPVTVPVSSPLPPLFAPAPPLTAKSRRGPSLFVVALLSIVVGGVAGVLASGALLFYAMQNPNVIKKFQPISDLLQTVNIAPSSKSVSQVTLQEESDVTKVAKDANPAVVSIVGTIQSTTQSFFFNQGSSAGQESGTGFIIDKAKGLILTNRHVVQDTASYQVITSSGDTIALDAKNIFIDPVNDLAIVKVTFPDPSKVSQLTLGDSVGLVPGQKVIAIGNALGQFSNTVTTGVVSALGREVDVSSTLGQTGESLVNMVQTDAAINPGNSGGPLLNVLGQVIGINTAIAGSAQNIGFAIPIDDVKVALESYLLNGTIIRPYLGVQYVTITKDLASVNKLPVTNGAYVSSVVSGGPADKAGIKASDIVTKINDNTLDETNNLIAIIQKFQVDDVVSVTYQHPDDPNSKTPIYTSKTVNVTLQKRQVASTTTPTVTQKQQLSPQDLFNSLLP